MELPYLFIDHYPFHDEAIKQENTEFMAAHIPNARRLPRPEVSHFSSLRDPAEFSADVLHFLEHAKSG